MKFRNLTSNGDWVFGAGLQSYATSLQALGLNLKTRIQSWVGDCFFAMNDGIDWKNLLDYNQQTRLTNAIKNIAIKTPGVISVGNVSFSLDANRTATIQLTIDTIYGSKIQQLVNLSAGG